MLSCCGDDTEHGGKKILWGGWSLPVVLDVFVDTADSLSRANFLTILWKMKK